MRPYEVIVPLESGYEVHLLVTAMDHHEAKTEANNRLRETCEPKGGGDAMRFCWRFDDIRVKAIAVSAATYHDLPEEA